ncbi:MAG: hypothetical protein GY769_16045 [bacterium]|nr:hypothetical protein [bacterium]
MHGDSGSRDESLPAVTDTAVDAERHIEGTWVWRFQHALDPDSPPSVATAVLDPRWLEPGRFPSLPARVELPAEMPVAEELPETTPAIPVEEAGSPFLRSLGDSMTDQWGFLFERASIRAAPGPPNVNTATRYAYNTFAVRQIAQHLEERGRDAARVLLCTAYETPVHELLEHPRVAEVLAIELSRQACEVVSEKYSRHASAGKLRLRQADYSGLEPGFQEVEADSLAEALDDRGRPSLEAVRKHFSSIASGRFLSPLEFNSGSFDAVHLPFVLGSLHLGALTALMGRCRAEGHEIGRDYEGFIGKAALETEEAQRAVRTVIAHALGETRRILRPGGVVVVNLWARPRLGSPELIRLSDTPVSRTTFEEVFQGFRRLFSGNPQPDLPRTVGHILAQRLAPSG